MKTFLNNKIILAVAALFIIGMFAYNFLAAPGVEPMLDELGTANVGTDLLELRKELELVTLDRSLFSDQKFMELSDFSTVIPQQTVGRPNPFDDIGRD